MYQKPEISISEGVERISRESGGLLSLEILRPEQLLSLSYAVFSGDAGALKRLQAAFDSSARIKRLARKNPVVCLCCPGSVRDPDAVLALLIAAVDSPTVAIASAICAKCAAQPEVQMTARASAAYIRAWPGLRCVEIHPEAGHA